jgi:hypothetical protein
MIKLTELLALDNVVAPQDCGTAPVTGTYVDVSNAGRFVALAKAGAVTAAKTLTVQLLQATSSGGAGAKNLGAAVVVAGAGGNAPADVKIEKQATDLDGAGGFVFVTAQLTINEAGKLGEAWLVRGDRRYQP